MKFQRIQDLRIDNDLTIKEISAMLGLHRDVLFPVMKKGFVIFQLTFS